MSQPNYHAPMGRGGRIFGAICCMLVALLLLFVGGVGVYAVVYDPRNPYTWAAALAGGVPGLLFTWYAVRILRNQKARGGDTTMPRWLVGIAGLVITAGALFALVSSHPHVYAAPAIAGGVAMIVYGFFGGRRA